MPQIAFHLKICVEAEAFSIARLQLTPELLRQARLGQIRDVRGHTGHGQTSGGRVDYVVNISATPLGIGLDRLLPDPMKNTAESRVRTAVVSTCTSRVSAYNNQKQKI